MGRSIAQYFGRWGVPLKPVEVSDEAQGWLEDQIGVPARPSTIPAVSGALPDKSGLTKVDITALSKVVGAGAISTDPADRVTHSMGCSLTDYLKLRRSESIPAPDAIVRPSSGEQVQSLLEICSRREIDVVPFGGGTSVVGGVTRVPSETRKQIAVAFDDMATVVSINETDATVTVQPGVTGPVLERILGASGFTLGHLPQSWARATIGGYVATRSAGQASAGYGRSDEMVETMTVATPVGTVTLGRAPKSAAGPDLRQLFIGSEGILCILTEVTLRVRRLPEHTKYEGLMFPSFEAGEQAFRQLAQSGLTADVMRLSDEAETVVTLQMSGPTGRAGQAFDKYLDLRKVAGGCLAILGWEGHSKRAMSARRSAAWSIIRKNGGATLGGSVGASWRNHRYDGPYLRDELLDRGYIVETLETATYYSQIPALKAAVTKAVKDSLADGVGEPYVMCHISHVYETGCSLYFTVIAVADEDPVAQWAAAKTAACDAIMDHAGTITHHHSVGADHAPWLEREIGDVGIDILRATKKAVDPKSIMNPGKLIP